MPQQAITISDVAQALGMSKTTVSRAISGKGRVSEETRQKVQDYIQQHNYRPNAVARGLAQNKTYNIALVISSQFSNFDLPFVRKSMTAVCEAASQTEYEVLLTIADRRSSTPLRRLLDKGKVDGALLDIGVSSLQLDENGRGFSFYGDGPLDMRMDQHSGELSAWHWVNRESFARLKECIATLGEEPQAGRIARVIVEARQKAPIDSTAELAALVEKAYPPAWRAKARRHPATRTFQALRMAVNDELGELRRFLDEILAWLPVGGRLAVITFHSLEDRMVKQAMRRWAEGCRCPRHVPVCVCRHQPEVRILHKKPVQAGPDELAVNPRAGSAKLRAVEIIAEASA